MSEKIAAPALRVKVAAIVRDLVLDQAAAAALDPATAANRCKNVAATARFLLNILT